MANLGPLAAEIGLVGWGTPANFNEFRVLAMPYMMVALPNIGGALCSTQQRLAHAHY